MVSFMIVDIIQQPENDEQRLTRLMETHGSSILRVCYLYLKDHALAQDAAQTTFVKAWKALGTLREGSTEKAWLMRIAVNTCRDALRTSWFRRLDRRVTPEELPLVSPGPQEPALAQAITRLPARDREVILLRYYEQLSPDEIAHMLRQPLNTVKSRLARAKKKLKQLLEGWNDDD